MHKINNLILIFSLLISLLCVNTEYYLLFMLPLSFGLGVKLISIKDNITPGISVLIVISIIRYLIYPIYFLYFPSSNLNINDEYINQAIVFMILEQYVILITIKIFRSRKNKIHNINDFEINNLIPLLLIISSFFLILKAPSVLSNIHFILNPHSILDEVEELTTDAGMLIIKWTITFFSLYFSYYYYKRNKFIMSFIGIFIQCIFFVGISRKSLLMPVIVSCFILYNFFPKKKKFIIYSNIIFILFAIGSLTLYKQFGGVENLNDLQLNEDEHLINIYFGGIKNVAVGLKSVDLFGDKVTISTIINDLFRNGMIISKFFVSDDNTTFYFNYAFSGIPGFYHQITPTLCQSIMYFGLPFFGVLPFIMTRIILWADKKFVETRRIDFIWLYATLAVRVAWNIPGSFQGLMQIFHSTFLPILILCIINNKFKILKLQYR